VGSCAIPSNSSGSYNVAVGYLSFPAQGGSGNVCIGAQLANGTASLLLNTSFYDNRVVMGHTSITNAYVQVPWTVVSDARDKTDFAPIPQGLEFVKQLKPVSYKFKLSRESSESTGPVRYGFKAQEILELEGDNPVIVDAEDPENLKFVDQHLIAVIVKAMQEQNALIETLSAELDLVKQQLKNLQ
jgi:hypothetical protein